MAIINLIFKFYLFYWQCAAFFITAAYSEETGCVFKLNENFPKTALILKDEPSPKFLLPDELNTIKIPKDSQFRISCAGKNIKNSAFFPKDLKVKCVKNDVVRFKHHIIYVKESRLQDLECQSLPEPTIKITDKRCHDYNKIIEIGYQVENSFLKIFSVCYDDFEEKTIYSWYENSNLYLGREQKIKNSEFLGENDYLTPLSKIYEYNYQKKMFTELLKSEELANNYILNDNLHRIVASLLIPKEEMMYGPEQKSLFHYLNTAPQWQIFKEGNWGKLEQNIREFLVKDGKKYSVVSGTYGVATLPDIFQEQKKLYLYSDKFDNNYVAVPKFFWKIVYDKQAKTGIAIIGIHNPFIKEVPADQIICSDISAEISWLKLDRKQIERGYFYACEVEAFLKATGFSNILD